LAHNGARTGIKEIGHDDLDASWPKVAPFFREYKRDIAQLMQLGVAQKDPIILSAAIGLVRGATTYRQILAWNTQDGELLVASADGRLFKIQEADGTAAEVVLDRQETPFATLDTLKTLARTTPGLIRVKAENFDDSWAVLAEHEMYEEPRIVFELPHRIADPVMTADQSSIFFVSDRE
jgi:hypothetical protein